MTEKHTMLLARDMKEAATLEITDEELDELNRIAEEGDRSDSEYGPLRLRVLRIICDAMRRMGLL
jgi:hypothetical protein